MKRLIKARLSTFSAARARKRIHFYKSASVMSAQRHARTAILSFSAPFAIDKRRKYANAPDMPAISSPPAAFTGGNSKTTPYSHTRCKHTQWAYCVDAARVSESRASSSQVQLQRRKQRARTRQNYPRQRLHSAVCTHAKPREVSPTLPLAAARSPDEERDAHPLSGCIPISNANHASIQIRLSECATAVAAVSLPSFALSCFTSIIKWFAFRCVFCLAKCLVDF